MLNLKSWRTIKEFANNSIEEINTDALHDSMIITHRERLTDAITLTIQKSTLIKGLKEREDY